jgi:hypothetical protein
MTDTLLNSPSIASTAEKWKGIKAAFRVDKPSEDQASYHMLSLARTNLGVRLRAIDETSLVSDCQKKIYVTVTEMLKAPPKSNANTRNFEWDELYKAESLIALLYNGEQLRYEIGARLEELATVDQAEADNLRRDNQEVIKQPPRVKSRVGRFHGSDALVARPGGAPLECKEKIFGAAASRAGDQSHPHLFVGFVCLAGRTFRLCHLGC